VGRLSAVALARRSLAAGASRFPATLRLAVLAAIFTWLVCRISWPGFMSFDSMYALRQARTGIEAGSYPPMVSYLWWLCERIIPGQGGMFALGNALAFGGVAALGRAIGARELRILLAMLLLVYAPLTLGPMLVVWKDVPFGGLMAIGYAITLKAIDDRRPAVIAAAVLSLVFASTFRLNGVAAAAPALAALAWTLCAPRAGTERIASTLCAPRPGTARIASPLDRQRLLASGGVFVGLLAMTVGLVAMISLWRLPDLKRVALPTGNAGVQLHDLLGISVCAKTSLLPPAIHSGDMTLERLRKVYRPEHVQLSLGPPPLLNEAVVEAHGHEVEASAATARIAHPWCYLEHRVRVFLHAIGANSGPVFYLVNPDVFPGEALTDVVPTDRTARTLAYIVQHESSVFARGYLYAFLAVFALVAARHEPYRGRRTKALLPMAGAVAYMAGSFFVMPAADARYNFWPNLVFMVTFCCVLPLPRIRASFRTQ